jgi:cytochrome d ubiquinol oxidase subunit I
MQQPVGYALNHGRAEMVNFFEVVSNPHVITQFPHTVLSGLTTGAFFVIGISAYHLLRNNEVDFFKRSFRIAAIFAVVASILVAVMGHIQGQHMVQVQPMKMASAEALWETEKGADFSFFAIIDSANHKNLMKVNMVLEIICHPLN